MKMLFLVFLACLLCSCTERQRGENAIVSSDRDSILTESDKKQKRDPQLLSTYAEGQDDAYSWRQREMRYRKSALGLSKDVLTSTIWTPGDSMENVFIVFYYDDVFRFGSVQAGFMASGGYHLAGNNSVALTVDWERPDMKDIWLTEFPPFKEKHVTLWFEKGLNKLWYDDGLVHPESGFTFYAMGSELPLGTETVVDGIRVIRVMDEMVVTDRVRFRTLPSTSAPEISVVYFDPINPVPELPFFLRGTRLLAIARKLKPDAIDSWQNYWYYVRRIRFENPEFGWVYGEFISKFELSESATYAKALRKEKELARK